MGLLTLGFVNVGDVLLALIELFFASGDEDPSLSLEEVRSRSSVAVISGRIRGPLRGRVEIWCRREAEEWAGEGERVEDERKPDPCDSS